MKWRIITVLLLLLPLPQLLAQRGFNYYKDSLRVGSPNAKAFDYFRRAYYDHIWKWSAVGADSAEYYLKLAIKEDSAYSAAYAFLAHVYQFKTYDNQDWDKKLALEKELAEKALSFHPKTGDAYSVMSDVKWHEKDTVQALNLLREAIAMEPDNVGNYVWIAIRFKQTGTAYDSAIIYLHRLIALDPEYGQAYMKLGNIYHQDVNKPDSAKFYYHKTIEHYNNVKPRDRRMMDAYYWLGNLFESEKRYDSAVFYYNSFLKEIEPSDMYIREMRLSSTYKSLYDCYRQLSGRFMQQFIGLNEKRIADNPKDANLLLGILSSLVEIEQDSIISTHALPLARRIQTLSAKDPYIIINAVYFEAILLKKQKKEKAAMKVFQDFLVGHPGEPLVLFELGRMKILANDIEAGIACLAKAKRNLNSVINRSLFLAELEGADFDKARKLPAFRQLLE